MPRFDVPCRRSGFWGIVAVRAREGASVVTIEAEVLRSDGGAERVRLGEIPVVAPPAQPSVPQRRQARIAICMGTYEPDLSLFEAQIESIRRQSDTDWVCVISDDHSSRARYTEIEAIVGDDARFHLSRAGARRGFYRNFERALSLAPVDAELIALCDQDDVWHVDKLQVLRRAIGSAMLVYSDMRLVDERGRLLRETLWRGRRNNSTNLTSMLIANTVTGAASLFRREVAELALPFPDCPGLEFHDHWLALVALASGALAYVDRPLYDYVQHGRAIVGKGSSSDNPHQRRPALRKPRLREWRAAYFLGYVPGAMRARTLLLRCSERLTPAKRRGLERYLAAESTAVGLAWFLSRPARLLIGRTETLGGEWEVAVGIVWAHLARLVARVPRWPDRLTLDTRFPDPPSFDQKRLRRWRERA